MQIDLFPARWAVGLKKRRQTGNPWFASRFHLYASFAAMFVAHPFVSLQGASRKAHDPRDAHLTLCQLTGRSPAGQRTKELSEECCIFHLGIRGCLQMHNMFGRVYAAGSSTGVYTATICSYVQPTLSVCRV